SIRPRQLRIPLPYVGYDALEIRGKRPMIFKWFDTGEVDALAERMVTEFRDRLPLADCEAGGKKAEARLRSAHDTLLQQAREFATNNKLNIYKKSRLANRVKWALL